MRSTPHNPLTIEELLARAYHRGRTDFVEIVAASLNEPAMKDVPITPAQMADVLKQASDKCNAAPKSLTN